jgi:hypothetical protein
MLSQKVSLNSSEPSMTAHNLVTDETTARRTPTFAAPRMMFMLPPPLNENPHTGIAITDGATLTGLIRSTPQMRPT